MTINEFIQSHDIKGVSVTVLRQYGHRQVDVFINEIQNMIDSGINVNKPIKKLFDEIKATPLFIVEENVKEQDTIVRKLTGIPLEQIQYYIDGSGVYSYSKNKSSVSRIKDLADLYRYETSNKNKRFLDAIRRWQEVLREKAEQIIEDWNMYNKMFDLPEEFDENDSPVISIVKAIKDLISFLGKRKDKRIYSEEFNGMSQTYFILDKFYNEKKSLTEIGLELGSTGEKPGEGSRQIKQRIVEALLSGDTVCHNLRLNRDLLEILNGIKKSCLYRSEETCCQFLGGADDDQIKEILKCDFVEIVEGVRFIVPGGKKGLYTRVTKHLLDKLQSSVAFVDKDTIFFWVDDKFENEDYEIEFVENVLSCDEIVEKQVDPEDNTLKYRIKAECLATKEQKMARVIYDNGPITTNDANAKFKELFNAVPSVNFSSLKKYEIYSNNKVWTYGKSEKLDHYKSIIKEFVDEKIEFYFIDVIARLEEKGYNSSDINEKSIRTSITGLGCRVDLKDSNHFCRDDYLEDHPETTWRNPNRDGVTNWILNCIKEALDGKNGIDKEELIDIIRAKAAGTDYEHKIQQRTKSAIDMFNGPGQPFILQDNTVMRNDAEFSKTDFDFIGLRGGKYPFYKQIRAIIANEIKRVESGRLLFTDAIKIINDNLDEKQDRNTIVRAIENKHLQPINVVLQNIDDKVYLVRTTDISTEPNYEIKPSKNEDEITVQVVEDSEKKRSAITYRIKVNWSELADKLKRELKYYSKWMQYERIDDFGAAVDGFLGFIKDSENSNLNQKLPQNLYEYHFAQNDHYDRSTYLSNLCIFYEGLLADLYYERNGARFRGKGLMDLALQLPWLDKNVRLMNSSRQPKGFERIFRDLYYKRNLFAHGSSVELTSAETAIKIAEYTALYIFTIAKLK